MIPLPGIVGKNIAVFGLGKAGNAAVASLLASGATVYAWDDGEASRAALAPHAALHVMPFETWPWSGLEYLVLSPGVPLTHQPHPVVIQARTAGCQILGEVELLTRACPDATYIGITGTNGKSTTTSLIAHLLAHGGRQVEVGGNLGTPALALAPLGNGGIYVIEMSSYQLDLMQNGRFHIGVMLNLTPDHLDRHGDMEGYKAAKLRLFATQQRGDHAVVAVDDPYTQAIANELRGRAAALISVATHPTGHTDIHVDAEGVLHDGETQIPLQGIAALTGRHNWQNAAAAFAVCRAAGLDAPTILEGLRLYPGLAHRMELVRSLRGVRFVNDSKATNADATQHALAAYDAIYWIAGGKPKAGGIDSLQPFFSRIRHAFLIGEAQDAFAATLERSHVPFTKCGTLAVATEKAAYHALIDHAPGAVVVLSPACASFDQWKSFEARGDAFRTQVLAIESSDTLKTG